MTAITFDQRRASSRATASPRRSPIQCATSSTAGKAIPKHAKMMWNPREAPIWLPAGPAPAAWVTSAAITAGAERAAGPAESSMRGA
jgi:hypothetical protein